MAFCAKCGATLTEGVTFCAGCGAPVGAAVPGAPAGAPAAAPGAMAANVAGLLAYVLGFITGIIFLTQPEKARLKLISQGIGTVGWALRLAAIYIFLLALSLAGKIGGGLSTLLVIAVLVGLIWGYLYLMRKSAKLFTEKLALLPINTLKGYALIQIIVGALMIMLHRRIW